MSEAKRPRLRAETRSYTIDEPELCEWLTGAEEPRFYIKEVWIQPNGSIEFTVTTEKQAEVPVVRRVAEMRPDGAVDRYVDESRLPHDASGLTPNDEGYDETTATGPVLEDDGVGTADPTPMIARPAEVAGKRRLKTVRELRLEAQKAGRPAPASHITHREDDDPVPSAIPR